MIILKFFIIFFLIISNANAKYENYAAMVVNTKDGEILYSQNPDKIVHLASITKLMTLYLAFEALEDGRISLNDKVIISDFAARQLEKKIHLSAGKKYTFKELLMAAAIFSANDAAVAIAEEIGGGVEDFVYLMNQKAKNLGLLNTKYGNATGMPDAANYSTSKDIILLAQKLRKDFPQYYIIFGMEIFAQNGKIYGNSNRLLPYFKGLDGLKTGFTNIAGYNLACSFKYNDNNIVGVVFGMPTPTEREQHMKEILDYGIKKVLSRKMIKDDTTNEMILEYDNFLKGNSSAVSKNSLYFDIIANLFNRNNKEKTIADKIDKKNSILDKALLEISGFGDLISHPLPVFNED